MNNLDGFVKWINRLFEEQEEMSRFSVKNNKFLVFVFLKISLSGHLETGHDIKRSKVVENTNWHETPTAPFRPRAIDLKKQGALGLNQKRKCALKKFTHAKKIKNKHLGNCQEKQ